MLSQQQSELPEAPASATFKINVAGVEVLFTMRGFDPVSLHEKLLDLIPTMLPKVDVSPTPKNAPQVKIEPQEFIPEEGVECQMHGVVMKKRDKYSGAWVHFKKDPQGRWWTCDGGGWKGQKS